MQCLPQLQHSPFVDLRNVYLSSIKTARNRDEIVTILHQIFEQTITHKEHQDFPSRGKTLILEIATHYLLQKELSKQTRLAVFLINSQLADHARTLCDVKAPENYSTLNEWEVVCCAPTIANQYQQLAKQLYAYKITKSYGVANFLEVNEVLRRLLDYIGINTENALERSALQSPAIS